MADAGGIPCSCRFHLVTGSVAGDRGVSRERPGFPREHVHAPGAGQAVLYLCPTLAAHPGYTRRRLLHRVLLFAGLTSQIRHLPALRNCPLKTVAALWLSLDRAQHIL